MNKTAVFMVFFTMFMTPNILHAGHVAGQDGGAPQSCFYDNNDGKGKWHYYFCGHGTTIEQCAGNTYHGPGGNYAASHGSNKDTRIVYLNMEELTFTTAPKDTYCCCGGTDKTAGTFKPGKCLTGKRTPADKKPLGDGKYCQRYTLETICGTQTEPTDCTEPEDGVCDTGYQWRGLAKSCAKPCTGDTVYESPTSGECVTCPTTNYQGISDKDDKGTKTERYCKKCDSETEFFNKATKECIKKSTMKAYSSLDMLACWQCPSIQTMKICMQARLAAQEETESDTDILDAMKTKAATMGVSDIVTKCHLQN